MPCRPPQEEARPVCQISEHNSPLNDEFEAALVKMSGDILVHLPHDATFQIPGNKSQMISDLDASFSVRLFPDGFSIGKRTERWKEPPSAQEVMDMMYPYNRTSESFLRALDAGCIPGDLLEDIPCKYVNGCVVCEILDYRANAPSSGDTLSSKSSIDWKPVVHIVTLHPTTESIVKDISLMVDETWTYKDLMEVESRILKTVWPSLNLDPKLTSKQLESNATDVKHTSGYNIIKCYRTHKGALMDRRLRLAATARPTIKTGATQSKLIQPLIGLTIPSVQFPPSPGSSISGTPVTPLGHEPSGFAADSKFRKRVNRDTEDVKLDIKRPKQMDTSMLKFDLKPMTDQQHQGNSSFQQEFDNGNQHNVPSAVPKLPLGCSEQDPKVICSVEDESISEIMMNHQTEFQKNANSEQHRLEDPVKIGEEHENLETDELEKQRLQQTFGRPQDLPSQSLQVLSPLGDRDRKQDDLLQRKKPPPSPKMLQKPDGRLSVQTSSSELSHMSPMPVQNVAAALGSSSNPVIVPPSTSLNQPKQTQATISGGSGPSDPMSLQQLKRRANPLPKTPITTGVASPGNTVSSGGIPGINSPSTANMPPVTAARSEAATGQNIMALLSVAQSHGLPAKKRKAEQLPDIKKIPPSWQLLLVALANTSSDEFKDTIRQRNMADSLIGGNVNVRKTRYLQFQRQIIQGLRRGPLRLVMCERPKDAMVEAVVQFGDDQDDEASNSVPHHVLPTMANAHAADLFAKQFCALLEKDGFELVDDQVQPAMPRGNAPMNAASTARPMQAGASTLGNNIGQLPSPRAMPPMAGMTGMPPMQPASSSGALAPTRMPPPGNASNRQITAGYLGQTGVGTFSKPLQVDGNASQLTAVQHAQQHQQALRAQQLVTPTQLAQLNATNHNSAQQINPQMVANQGQLQQFLQQRQQSQTSAVLQRKLMGMGSLGSMGNLGGVGIPGSGGTQSGLGNMVGLNGMNNVVGMAGMNNVSASMGGISSLGNGGQLPGIVAMGQNTGLGNFLGQQLRPGNLNASHLARLMPGRGGRSAGTANSTVRNPVENFTGMSTSNQVHISTGLPMIGQPLNRVGRVGLTGMLRAPVTSMGSPKVPTSNMPTVAGQSFYLNSQQQLNLQQLNSQNSQSQLNTQQSQLPLPQVNSQLQQQQHPNPQQLTPQQSKNSQPLNPQSSLNSPPQQQQMNPQSQINPASQQVNSQQLNNQQLVGGLGSIVGGPGSPQLSSQNLGNATGPSMDVQGGASLSSCGQ